MQPFDPNANKRPSKGSKQQVRATLQQILNEPFEIARTVGEQVEGNTAQPQEEAPQAQNSQEPAKPSVEEKKKGAILQAFQQELNEINQLSKNRREEMQQRRTQDEQLKKRKEEEQAKQHTPLLEPVAKKARGILGGMAGALKKKQRNVEMQKQPSN